VYLASFTEHNSPQGPHMLWQRSEYPPFSWLSNIPLNGETTFVCPPFTDSVWDASMRGYSK
jgi:hypothetical protein